MKNDFVAREDATISPLEEQLERIEKLVLEIQDAAPRIYAIQERLIEPQPESEEQDRKTLPSGSQIYVRLQRIEQLLADGIFRYNGALIQLEKLI